MLPRGVLHALGDVMYFASLATTPHNTNNTCKLHMCSMFFAPWGWQSTRLCMCTKNLHTNYFWGALAEGTRESKCGFTQSLRSSPYSASLRHAHAVCAKERAQTLAQAICKLELKLSVWNPHAQASPYAKKLMLSVVHFLRKCRQMTSHHVELMCGATPLSF